MNNPPLPEKILKMNGHDVEITYDIPSDPNKTASISSRPVDNPTPLPVKERQRITDEFLLMWGIAPEGTLKHEKGMLILNFILREVERGATTERERCKKIYVECVGWAEWGMDDIDAAEDFEKEYKEMFGPSPLSEGKEQ